MRLPTSIRRGRLPIALQFGTQRFRLLAGTGDTTADADTNVTLARVHFLVTFVVLDFQGLRAACNRLHGESVQHAFFSSPHSASRQPLAEVSTDRLLTRAASIEPDGVPTCPFFHPRRPRY